MSDWAARLQAEGAVIDTAGTGDGAVARVVRFAARADNPAATQEVPLACPLLEWTAVSIAGSDAPAFLQGQFTSDVEELPSGGVQYSGYCSPKGRLLANFPLARTTESEFVLVVPADLAAGFVRRLRMFLLRAKAVITPLSPTHACIGLSDPARAASGARVERPLDGVIALDLPDGRTIAVCEQAAAPGYWQQVTRDASRAGSPAWDLLAIRRGVGIVTAATQDRFVPQMLNWELLGGVSFRKGCYTGQEIVARMQYLGRLKERLYRARTHAADIMAGAPLYGTRFGDQGCGTVVTVAPSHAGGLEMLAVIQAASAESDAIRTGAPADAPGVELLPLPYEVPVAATAQR